MLDLLGDIDLGQAFEASPNPYLLVTPDLRMAGMNQAYLDMVRQRRSELIGKSVFDAFDGGTEESAGDSVRQLRASFESVFRTGHRSDIAVMRYAIPVKTADGTPGFWENYWSVTHTPIMDGDVVTHVLHHAIDITEMERLRQGAVAESDHEGRATPVSALDAIVGGSVLDRAHMVQEDNRRLEAERQRLVEMLMQAPGFVAVVSGPDHRFQLFNDAYSRLVGYRDLAGRTVVEAMPEVGEQGYIEMLDTVYETGEAAQGRGSLFRFRSASNGLADEVYLDFIYQPIRDGRGQVVGIFIQGYDVTDTVMAAERQKLMIDELNHRVKNTLATVQSIAMQTARSNADPARFAESFQARLLSLSHTHDLLTRSHWEGADLRAVLEHETAVHGAHRVLLNGPPVALDPAAALSFGMIFHELATNAAKYGALSTGDGRVMVDWAVADQTARRLMLEWREVGGPPTTEPDRRGFGSRLIERNVRHDLAGDVKLGYATDGFSAEISVPLDRGRRS